MRVSLVRSPPGEHKQTRLPLGQTRPVFCSPAKRPRLNAMRAAAVVPGFAPPRWEPHGDIVACSKPTRHLLPLVRGSLPPEPARPPGAGQKTPRLLGATSCSMRHYLIPTLHFVACKLLY